MDYAILRAGRIAEDQKVREIMYNQQMYNLPREYTRGLSPIFYAGDLRKPSGPKRYKRYTRNKYTKKRKSYPRNDFNIYL